MDIISHGLWGGVAMGKKGKKDFFVVFIISMLPDLLSLGIFWLFVFVGMSDPPRWIGTHLDYRSLPAFVDLLYNFTHSLLFFAILFFLVWDLRKKPFMPLLAWGMHILIDIPSHSFIAFPTPFLWPLSHYRYDGISWVEPKFIIPNILTLGLVYAGFFFHQKIRASRREQELAEID